MIHLNWVQCVSIHEKNAKVLMAFGIKMESVQKRLGVPILGIVATKPARLHRAARVDMIRLNWVQSVSIHRKNVKVSMACGMKMESV